KKGEQQKFLKTKLAYPETQIFYESPFRVADTLSLASTSVLTKGLATVNAAILVSANLEKFFILLPPIN
ncbi:MAG: hypothetical protein E6X40_08305, partial [Staphylococcus epidermidis]|nr:hypothetical protein [Staphylococcus epidermidis]